MTIWPVKNLCIILDEPEIFFPKNFEKYAILTVFITSFWSYRIPKIGIPWNQKNNNVAKFGNYVINFGMHMVLSFFSPYFPKANCCKMYVYTHVSICAKFGTNFSYPFTCRIRQICWENGTMKLHVKRVPKSVEFGVSVFFKTFCN